MNKYLILALLMCVCTPAPASAMLGEDHLMLRSFFSNPGRWPKEKHAPMKNFADVRKEMGPQLVQYFTDSEGLVQREYWLANGDMWTVEEANRIRSAIMKNQNPIASGNNGFRSFQFIYADGTQIYYRIARRRVFSILAVRKDFNPGDLGAKSEAYQRMMRIIRPED